MKEIHLRHVDLNLLTVFEAIYSEAQITKAARALGLTQPAVSHALARLRALFDDPLFVRDGASMVPTPRAQDLAAPVSVILDGVREIVGGPEPFDPANRIMHFGPMSAW